MKTAQAGAGALAALVLMSVWPCPALAIWPVDGARLDAPEAMPQAGLNATARTVDSARGLSPDSFERTIGEDVPQSICVLVEGMYTKDRALKMAGQAAALPFLLEDGSPVGTGMGYDLGPNLRFQGVGVFDTSENYAALGPAFRLSVREGFEITTGMQLPVTERTEGGLPDLYYAEFTLLF